MNDSEGGRVSQPGPATSLTRELFWVVPAVIAVGGATVFLLSNRAWGADAAAIIGFPLSVLAIIVTILIDRGAFKAPFLKVPRDRRRTFKSAAAFIVIVMLGTVAVWWIRRESDPFDYMSGDIRVGYVAFEYQGWHTDTGSGNPEGFDVDLVNEIQAYFSSSRVTWVDLGTLENRFAALRGEWSKDGAGVEQKPVKLVVSNFSMTPERAERVDFVGPYFVDSQGFLARDPKVTSISQIARGRVCVVRNSRSDEKLTQIGWNPVRENSLAACVAEFQGDRVDAVSNDRSLVAGFAKRLGLSPPVPLNYGAEKYGVAIPNNMPRLCAELTKVVNDFLTYNWSDSFRTHLAPLGLSEKMHVRPASADPCQPAGPWYR
ncbi:transporter substrate-binding domain-containing protein [Micromonospora cathayae]|uniref:Transporter substrate-binding domain-containing protein n=1 Tax=Micromonospora cathayae TaxID=3028804 RepID=A0ABY7ZM80_9ACTN|nr:transporter substrate-binding domain-containing protein [Micromonospora sp. HUAS 3]WDZ84110.1 transporter substrate-binding domain-containing protein [Micromonospora sp. HUAS 3]